MNATNRGVLRGLSLGLMSVRDILEAMSDAEQNKDLGGDGQPPLDGKFDSTSADIEQAAMCIDLAIRIMQSIAPDEADFEDYLEGIEVPEELPKVQYFKELYN